jgi:hypothetical protein
MADSSSRRSILIGLGALVILAGLVAAVVLWTLGDDRRREAVQSLARAPVGCDTTLDFAETGRYYVFIETTGTLGEIRGDCNVAGSYDIGSRTPPVELTVIDPDGAPVELDQGVADIDYSEAGFVGAAEFAVDILETDDHVIRVESSDDEVFVIAVGRDPRDGVAALRGGAVASGILALLLGAGLILLGVRSGRVRSPAPQWSPALAAQPPGFVPGSPPQGPPVFGQQAGPPPYGQPQYGQPQYGQPQYGQQAGPPPYGQPPQPAPPAGSRPQYSPAPPPPTATPQPPAPPPGQPQLPGQPGWGPAAQTPAPPGVAPAHGRPSDWAPQSSDDTAGDRAPEPSIEPGFDPERTQERPPPAPPN